MKISCIICSDLFVASNEVFITKCGHLFHHHCLINWFKRKSSCPQCRHPATERSIHKVYFSVQDSPSKEDIGALINKVENLEVKNLMSDKSLSEYKEKLKNQESICQDQRLQICKLEENERKNKFMVLSQKEQISTLKQKCEEADKLREELISLKQTLQNVKNVQTAIKGTAEEVETLIRNEGSIDSLALVASMLKKSLLDTQKKERNAEKSLGKLNTQFVALNQSHSELNSKYQALQIDQVHLKKNYEMEIRYLKQKINELVKQHQGSIPGTSLADNYSMSNSELISKDQKPSTATGVDCNDLACKVGQSSSTFVSGKPYSMSNSELISKDQKPSTATGVDCNDLACKVGQSSSTFVSGKPYSIFKSESNNSKDHKPSASAATGVSYDGLGGSSVEGPTAKPRAMKTKQSSLNIAKPPKIRKVSPREKPIWRPQNI